MMKLGKKLMVLMLAGLMSFGAAACGGGGDTSTGGGNKPSGGGSSASSEEPIVGVTNPYKLKVFSFTGGYGEEWLNSLVYRYKKERAGKQFTVDGKTYDGVEFELTKEKTTMVSMMNSGNNYDVWFQEQVYYNQLVENGNIFREMTDVLTEENPYEPGVTIESKMSNYHKEYYVRDGQYYGIPHYAGYIGLAYNKAMFAEYNWYFKKDYTAQEFAELECFIDKTNTTKSAGPDGMLGTDDDGLPTTYDEFFALCELISEKCNPITWAGKHRQEYLNWFKTALAANCEGMEQMSLNYSFDGTAKNLISVDANGNITELADLKINKDNGYELAKQAGKYYALKFLQRTIEDGYTASGASDVMYTQVQAQEDFVLSTGYDTTDSAMLVDGCWWEMEADRTFNDIEQGEGVDARDDFGWLPLPMPTQAGADERAAKLSAGEKGYTLADTHNSLAFIGKHVSGDLYDLCKDFLQFAYTDESLAEFTMITDTTKALSYSMSPAQKAQMSDYGRSLMEMQENADIVYTFSKNTFYQANEATFSQYKTSYSSKYSEKDASVVIAVDEFRVGISAEKYFTGLYLYQQDVWKNLVK